MRKQLAHVAISLGLLLLAGPLAADKGAGQVVETTEVERAQEKKTKHPSLQFLKDNRVFLRARLDQLRMETRRVRTDEGELLDERYLRLKEMAAAIAAARDTVRAEHEITSERELLTSVTQLGDLEAQLSLVEELLDDQRRRLLMLEEDFLGHQETALVVLVKGLPGDNAPTEIVFTEDSDIVRVGLTDSQRSSLAQGGIAQIYHEFVEPREHVYMVSFTGSDWSDAEPVAVRLEAARDRLTFLELDLSQLDRRRDTFGLLTSVWYR